MDTTADKKLLDKLYLVIVLTFALVILVVDTILPLGVAFGFIYNILVLASAFLFFNRSKIFIFTGICMGLIALGYFVSPESDVDEWKVILNRVLSMGMLAVTAFVCDFYIQAQKKLNKAQRDAREFERTAQELQNFAYVASHNLQEPLRKIVNYSGLLEQELDGKLDETTSRYFGFLKQSSFDIKETIANLLQFARVDRQTFHKEDVDLNDVASSAILDLEEEIESKHAIVSVTELPTVKGSYTLLFEAFTQVIGNALKFCHKNVSPRITISSRTGNYYHQISFSDNGLGVDIQDFTKIFELFKRLHHKDEIPGSGIGLALTRRILERHGGRVDVNSRKGFGSTFTLFFPID